MIKLIIYAVIMMILFIFYYTAHKEIHLDEWNYEDSDSVLFAVLLSISWPLTIWMGVPYTLINLYTKQKQQKQ